MNILNGDVDEVYNQMELVNFWSAHLWEERIVKRRRKILFCHRCKAWEERSEYYVSDSLFWSIYGFNIIYKVKLKLFSPA